MGNLQSAPKLIWVAAGRPASKWPTTQIDGCCATCGVPITEGVHRRDIESVSYTQHADFHKFGDYDCPACAWMHSYPKENHRNVIVAGEQLWWPMIGFDSATADRPHWQAVLRGIAQLPSDTPVCGCLTTDPKPRLWPRYRLCTVGGFGLYVHAPDYDQSGMIEFDLGQLFNCVEVISHCLRRGFAKRTVLLGLFTDYKRASTDMDATTNMEVELCKWRNRPEFIPALLVSHKGENSGHK